MTTTPVFGIPEIVQGQNTPHTTFNVAIALATAMQGGAIDITNTPPGSPSEGDVYVVGTAGTGAWSGRNNCVAVYFGAQWRFVPGNDDAGSPIAMGTSHEGFRIYIKDENQMKIWSGSAWVGQGVGPFLPLTGGTLGTATGGDQGVGTVNAINYFDDGVNINTIYAALAGATFTGRVSVAVGTHVGNTPSDSEFNLQSNDAGASGPTFTSYHNSASPLAADTIYRHAAYFNNGSGSVTIGFLINVGVDVVTAGAETSKASVITRNAGSNIVDMAFGGGVHIGGGTATLTGQGYLNCTNTIRTGQFAVGTLPAAATAGAGARAYVTDATVTTFASVVAGGGANAVPVYSDGANWRIG